MTDRTARAGRLPIVIAAMFAVAVAAAAARRVPDILDRPLSLLAGAPVPVPIPYGATQGSESVRDIIIAVEDVGAIERFDEIRLYIGTFGTTPILRYGWFQIAGRPCSYQASETRLVENDAVTFKRTGACGAPAPVTGTGTLRLALEGPARYARAAIWTANPLPGTVPRLSVKPFNDTLGLAGRGIEHRPGPPVSRAGLLAFMWDLQPWQVWMSLVVALSLVIAGAALTGATRTAGTTASSFAIAAGLALCYAVTVPPLQAPDEPDHLLSFAKLTGRPAFHDAVSSWARRIHFYRMTFLSNERFTPADREQAFDRDWPPLEIFAEDVARRSSTATRLWQVLAPAVPDNPAHALLLFRIMDAVIFGAGIGAGAALLSAARGGRATSGVVLVLLMVPTLAFFGMHMSELAFTLTAFILTGYTALALASGGSLRYAGLMLGVATALIAAGPRNGWPALLLIAGLCAARIATRLIGSERARDAAWFWAGLAVPGVVLFGTGLLWVPTPFYEQWKFGGFDPRGGVSAVQFIVPLIAGALAGALAERVAGFVAPFRPSEWLARTVCITAALGVCVSLAWSIFAPLPQLPSVESAPAATAAGYVWSVIVTLATAARVRAFDFLTWTSLWGGFGWINPILPAFAIAAVTIIVSLASAGTLVSYAQAKDGRAAVVAACALAAILATVAAVALSSFGLNRNVHGRYLLGACVVAMCLLVAPFLAYGGRRIGEEGRSAALYAFCCALHGYALTFLLGKYFG